MYSSLKTEEISLWCDAEPTDDKRRDGKGKKGVVAPHQSWRKRMWMSTSKRLQKSMGILTVYLNGDYGLKLSTAVPMTAKILHLLFLCLGLYLNTVKRFFCKKKLAIPMHLVLQRILVLQHPSYQLQYLQERVWIYAWRICNCVSFSSCLMIIFCPKRCFLNRRSKEMFIH